MDEMLLRRLNAERFRKLLVEEADPERRQMLHRLLAEHSERHAERRPRV